MPLPFDADEIARLQLETVQRWHERPIDNPHEGFMAIVCQQHEHNFRLWHEEDIARSPTATDREIAAVKRKIDRLNQARNDAIEQLDDALTEILCEKGIAPDDSVALNSETAGSVIDRLSILSLRLYHYREQSWRTDTEETHRGKVQQRIAVCEQQRLDLIESLQELLNDLLDGRKRHKTYRQLKMYNDPSLNPLIYETKSIRRDD